MVETDRVTYASHQAVRRQRESCASDAVGNSCLIEIQRIQKKQRTGVAEL